MDIEYLPSELKFNILSRVPAESLFQLRCVCKSWQTLVDDPFFREIHTHRLLNNPSTDDHPVNVSLFQRVHARPKRYNPNKFEFAEFRSSNEQVEEEEEDEFSHYKLSKPITPPPGYEMRGYFSYLSSCNGLICLFLRNTVVFNPLTRECMYLPPFKNHAAYVDAWGFGYHPYSKEYKVVRIFKTSLPLRRRRAIQHVYVHTVGSPKWRFVGEVPTCFHYCEAIDLPGVLVNGALHWFDVTGMIMSFDLLTEKFRSILPPPPFIGMSACGFGRAKLGLGVSGNSLCVTRHKRCEYIEMWMMKNNNGSWAKEFYIPIIEESLLNSDSMQYQRCKFITVMKSGKVLFCFMGVMASYDPKKEKLSLHKYDWLMDSVLHTNSFVSLKGFKRFEQIQASENIRNNGIA